MAVFPHHSPKSLVERLHARAKEAKEELASILFDPIVGLMDRLVKKHRLPHDARFLAQRALLAVETHLRTCRVAEFADTSWPQFQARVLFYLGKMAFRVADPAQRNILNHPALPKSPAYDTQSVFLPFERVGAYWLGGDHVGGELDSDGSLWVLVTDVTGHGYPAYLVAENVPRLWRIAWDGLPPHEREPIRLLESLHELLEDCLPEGVFIEATLARLRRDGTTTIMPAGGSRVLRRSASDEIPVMHSLPGSWLGLTAPNPGDQQSWSTELGDELLLGSDGLFDQISEHGNASGGLRWSLGRIAEHATLFDGTVHVLREALDSLGQMDDITGIAMRRLDLSPARRDIVGAAGMQ